LYRTADAARICENGDGVAAKDGDLVKIGRAARGGSGRTATIVTLPGKRRAPGPAAAPGPHPCATCGVCCRSYLVPVCGYDVWLISRRLHLEPARFVVAWQEEEPSVDGFRIEPGGPPFSLVLDKRGWSRERSPCVFLLRLPGGHDRCGIYQHRPVSCRAYPMVLLGDAVALRDDPLCPPGAWSPEDARLPVWRDELQHARMQFDVYRAVVDRWNARIGAAPPSTSVDLSDYYGYLLATYDALAELDAGIGQGGLARLRAGWRAPLHTVGPDGTGARVDDMPWQNHLNRVRAVVERF
jgi:Fe-S-cluster containining protein